MRKVDKDKAAARRFAQEIRDHELTAFVEIPAGSFYARCRKCGGFVVSLNLQLTDGTSPIVIKEDMCDGGPRG